MPSEPKSENGQRHSGSAEKKRLGFRRLTAWWNDPFRSRASWTDMAIVFLTFGIVLMAYLQIRVMQESGKQTDKLIKAANINAYSAKKSAEAAMSFAATASEINNGISHAVDKLNLQAKSMEKSAGAAVQTAQSTKNQLEKGERPWVGVSGQLQVIGPIHADASKVNFYYNLTNVGKSVALGVSSAIWVDGGIPGFNLMHSDHCERMASATRQSIALWRQWLKHGGPQPGGVTPKTGTTIFPGGIEYSLMPPQEGAPNRPEENVYALVCTVYYDQFDNVHLTQDMFCFTSQSQKLKDEGEMLCKEGNYAY